MRIVRKILRKAAMIFRRAFYRILQDAHVSGKPINSSPLLAQGAGKISFAKNVHVGVENDADFWNSYAFFNPRNENAKIEIAENVWVGNRFVAIAEGPGIFIGKNTLIGNGVKIYDSDFHSTAPEVRLSAMPKRAAVKIAEDVWIGDNVMILKGSEIAEHSVVAAGAVVAGKFPAGVILGGVPAKIIGEVHG